ELPELSDDPAWARTWQRLKTMLREAGTANAGFLWVDGTIWSPGERDAIKQAVEYKYQVTVDLQLCFKPSDLNQSRLPLFSPDLALDAAPEVLLEQLHELLPKLVNGQSPFWALAIWQWARGVLPASLHKAWQALLPDADNVETLLMRVLGEQDIVLKIKTALLDLPVRAVGAWCALEPFSAPLPGELYTAEEFYLPAAALLSPQLWSALENADIVAAELAAFFGMQKTDAEQLLSNRQLFIGAGGKLFQSKLKDPNKYDELARQLLAKLGAGATSYQAPAWRLDVELILNWEEYAYCYLLPRTSTTEHTKLKNFAPGVWLCLGEGAPPKLPGVALALEQQDVLALLCTGEPAEAFMLLNRLAAPQHGINTSRAFRTTGGLGNLVKLHFAGREDSLEKLRAGLKQADDGSNGSVVIIGGRRGGKTSLREKIKDEEKQRIILDFNFQQDVPEGRNEIELEHWFFRRMAEKLGKHLQSSDYSWPSAYKGQQAARLKAREQVLRYL
ncbi:MAG: hypothetical protein ABL925_21675, partial [Methylococcales bacterium]